MPAVLHRHPGRALRLGADAFSGRCAQVLRLGAAPTGKSVTELEVLHGVLQNPQMRSHAFFYFRDPVATQAEPEGIRRLVYAETDPEQIKNLAELKKKIRYSGYPVMENYPARWDPEAYDRPSKSKGRLVDLEAFGERVRDQLWEAIQAKHQLPEKPPAETQPDPMVEELDYHNRFMESRLRVYVGREQLNRDLLAFAEGDEPVACLVTGPSGSGKSAALAWFVTAALTKDGGFMGACALTAEMEAFQHYENICRKAFAVPGTRSHIYTRIIPAVYGEFGRHEMFHDADAALDLLADMPAFVSPLMPIIWFFDVHAVASRNLLVPAFRETETYADVDAAHKQIFAELRSNMRPNRTIPL